MHFDKRGGVAGGGGGGGRENKRIKGICASFRCGCPSIFHGNGVLYKNSDQLVILLQLDKSFGSPLNPRPQAKTTFSSLCNVNTV